MTANALLIDSNSNEVGKCLRDPAEKQDISIETLIRDGFNCLCFGAGMGFTRELYNKFGCPPTYLGCTDIMFPFYALLLKGASYVHSPLLKYRVHDLNTALALRHDQAVDVRDKHIIEEKIHFIHGAQVLLMEKCLQKLSIINPDIYEPLKEKLLPLIHKSFSERMRRLVETRIPLYHFGDVELNVIGVNKTTWIQLRSATSVNLLR